MFNCVFFYFKQKTADDFLIIDWSSDVCSSDLPLHHPADGPPPRSGEEQDSITLTAHVSKGTYIRSLARDTARAVGTVGHVTMHRRPTAGPFDLSQEISLDNLNAFGQWPAQSEVIPPTVAG